MLVEAALAVGVGEGDAEGAALAVHGEGGTLGEGAELVEGDAVGFEGGDLAGKGVARGAGEAAAASPEWAGGRDLDDAEAVEGGWVGGGGVVDCEDRAVVVLEGEVAGFEGGEGAAEVGSGGEPLIEEFVEDRRLERGDEEGERVAVDGEDGTLRVLASEEFSEDGLLGAGVAWEGVDRAGEVARGVEGAGVCVDVGVRWIRREQERHDALKVARDECGADGVVVREEAKALLADAVGNAEAFEAVEDGLGFADLGEMHAADADGEAVALEVTGFEFVAVVVGPEDADLVVDEHREVFDLFARDVDGDDLARDGVLVLEPGVADVHAADVEVLGDDLDHLRGGEAGLLHEHGDVLGAGGAAGGTGGFVGGDLIDEEVLGAFAEAATDAGDVAGEEGGGVGVWRGWAVVHGEESALGVGTRVRAPRSRRRRGRARRRRWGRWWRCPARWRRWGASRC